jgi:hypothetical protein
MTTRHRLTALTAVVGALAIAAPAAHAATPVPSLAPAHPVTFQTPWGQAYQDGAAAALAGWQAGAAAGLAGWQAGLTAAQGGWQAGAAALGLVPLAGR